MKTEQGTLTPFRDGAGAATWRLARLSERAIQSPVRQHSHRNNEGVRVGCLVSGGTAYTFVRLSRFCRQQSPKRGTGVHSLNSCAFSFSPLKVGSSSLPSLLSRLLPVSATFGRNKTDIMSLVLGKCMISKHCCGFAEQLKKQPHIKNTLQNNRKDMEKSRQRNQKQCKAMTHAPFRWGCLVCSFF